MTIVHHNDYSDVVSTGKRCFLFTGFLSKIDITDKIQRVDHLSTKDRPAWLKMAASAVIGGGSFFIPGALIGITVVKPNHRYYFIVVLTDGTVLPIETSDKLVATFFMRRITN